MQTDTKTTGEPSRTNLPDAPVPPEVDLNDFKFMPLDVRRLLKSETWIDAAEHPRLAHALVCLWAESWHQIPAASLPDNDRVLARFAMCDREAWAAIRDKALKGWIRCSDGLLYHPVVAEKALEAWKRKLDQRKRTKAATEARQRHRRAQQQTNAGDRDDERNVDRNVERDGVRNDQRNVVQETGTGTGTGTGDREAPLIKTYAFEGSVLRISQRDLDQWESAFSTFPDLRAELAVIDAKFAENPPAKPFLAAAGWLRKEHERRLAAGASPRQTAPPASNPEADQWRARLKSYASGRKWRHDQWGPEPNADGCLCPPSILSEFKATAATGAAA
jgi:hypothetical protein